MRVAAREQNSGQRAQSFGYKIGLWHGHEKITSPSTVANSVPKWPIENAALAVPEHAPKREVHFPANLNGHGNRLVGSAKAASARKWPWTSVSRIGTSTTAPGCRMRLLRAAPRGGHIWGPGRISCRELLAPLERRPRARLPGVALPASGFRLLAARPAHAGGDRHLAIHGRYRAGASAARRSLSAAGDPQRQPARSLGSRGAAPVGAAGALSAVHRPSAPQEEPGGAAAAAASPPRFVAGAGRRPAPRLCRRAAPRGGATGRGRTVAHAGRDRRGGEAVAAAALHRAGLSVAGRRLRAARGGGHERGQAGVSVAL